MRRALLLSGLALGAIAAACSSKGADPPPPPPGATSVVVGVQGEQIVGVLDTVHVTTSVNGVPSSDDTLDLKASPTSLPKEIRLAPPAGDDGAAIAVHVEGSGPGNVTLVRDAVSAFLPGETKLLRVQLESHCTATPLFPVGCPSGQTCLSGRCQSDDVPTNALEDYETNWAADVPDVCKPAGAGAAVVIVGTGQSDYTPVTDGETLQAQRGPQGGHHIWIAVRMKNLKQSLSTTTITGVQPGTGATIPPTSFVFTFEPDDGGYCKLFGLRYQLDNGGIDYHQFLGKPLDLTVTVLDTAGTQSSGVAHINVDPTVLGEPPPDAGP